MKLMNQKFWELKGESHLHKENPWTFQCYTFLVGNTREIKELCILNKIELEPLGFNVVNNQLNLYQ